MNLSELITTGTNVTINVTPTDLKTFGETIAKEILSHKEQPKEDKGALITGDEVCEILSISRVTLWSWDKKKITKPVRLGNLKRYRLSDIQELTGNKNPVKC